MKQSTSNEPRRTAPSRREHWFVVCAAWTEQAHPDTEDGAGDTVDRLARASSPCNSKHYIVTAPDIARARERYSEIANEL